MATSPARALRASDVFPVLLALLSLAPQPSGAIQLRWSTGASDLSFSQNTRATLIVHADSAEAVLPGEWRLLWTADSSGIQFVAPESLVACQSDTAKVSAIDPPGTSADSVAHLITAHFCSDGGLSALAGLWTLDLVSGSRGKLKVVALDCSDPYLVRQVSA